MKKPLEIELPFSIIGKAENTGRLLFREIELKNKTQMPTVRNQIGIRPHSFLFWSWGKPEWVDTSDTPKLEVELARHGYVLE